MPKSFAREILRSVAFYAEAFDGDHGAVFAAFVNRFDVDGSNRALLAPPLRRVKGGLSRWTRTKRQPIQGKTASDA
jgi:hypothetical protein